MTDRVLVGVAGGSGSGKTTVVDEILRGLAPFPVSVLHHDAYYRDLSHISFEERVEVNFDHPDALETPLLVEHLTRLRAGEPVEVPLYDFSKHIRRPESRTVEATPVIILDGILVLAEARIRSSSFLGTARWPSKTTVATSPSANLMAKPGMGR